MNGSLLRKSEIVDRPRLSERQLCSDLKQAAIGQSPRKCPADRLAPGRAIVQRMLKENEATLLEKWYARFGR